MTFFDLLRGVIYYSSKNNSIQEVTNEELQQFTPYMMNRWISFYDTHKAIFVNETLNKFTGLFDDKRDSFMLYFNLTPKSKFKKIDYVKKKKEKQEKEDASVSIIAKNNNISRREVQMYVDLFKDMHK